MSTPARFSRHRLRLVGSSAVVAAIAGILLLAAPAAQAGLLGGVVNLNACNSNAETQAFLPWGDPSSYELAPGGNFADSSWTLSGGASIVPGGEPYAASGTLSASSLSLPAGASGQSPSTCVDAAYPTVRFFIGGTGTVAVSVVYDGLAIPAGVAAGGGSWAPSPVAVTLSPVFGALSGGTAQVELRLTALTGNPRVSDVFIDPWSRY